MQAASKDEVSMYTYIDDPFSPIRMFQDIVAGNIAWHQWHVHVQKHWSCPKKFNQKYRDLTEMAF